MTKLIDTQQSTAHHICVFGDPKTGKSTLVSELAKRGYELTWVSVDNGHSVLYKLPRDAQERVDLIRLPDTRDFPVGIATCLKISTGASLKICDLHGQVDCSACRRNNGSIWSTVHCNSFTNKQIVVFDNISQVADSAMNFACEGKPDGYKSGYDEYRMQGFLMNKFLTALQQANFHSICIAHVIETEGEDGRKKLYPFVGSAPFSRFAGKYFDHMVYCETRNQKHRFGSSSVFVNNVVSGSRSDVAIEKLDTPSLVPIMTSIIVMQETDKGKAEKIIEGVKENVSQLAIRDDSGSTAVAGTDTIPEAINKSEEQGPVNSDKIETGSGIQTEKTETKSITPTQEGVRESGEKERILEASRAQTSGMSQGTRDVQNAGTGESQADKAKRMLAMLTGKGK